MTKAEDQCRDYQQERRSVPVERPDDFVTQCLAVLAACRVSGIKVSGLAIKVSGLAGRFVKMDVDREMNAAECRRFAEWLLKAAEWIEEGKCPR